MHQANKSTHLFFKGTSGYSLWGTMSKASGDLTTIKGKKKHFLLSAVARLSKG